VVVDCGRYEVVVFGVFLLRIYSKQAKVPRFEKSPIIMESLF